MARPAGAARPLNAMEDRNFELLMLALVPGLDPRARAALRAAADLGDVLHRPQVHQDRLPEAAVTAIASGAVRREAEREAEAARRAGTRLLAWGRPGYPSLLAETSDPPLVLWVRGDPGALECERAVGIVGSRQATGAGRALARAMARDLAAAGATIVSGLALGIDGEAHRGALEAGGRTVAVLGSGLARVYPASHVPLAEQVARAGAVVSEFPPATPPYKVNFPRRNRVIAGLAHAVVVVEAAARSGALVTARCAVDEGRDVLAVPGHPGSPTAEGTNGLIREGAVLVRGAADVADELDLVLPGPAARAGEPVLDALRGPAPLTVDELHRRSGLPVAALLQRLGELEIERKVRRLPGALFVRSA